MQTSENRDRNDLSFHSIVLPVFQRNRRSSSEPLVQPVIFIPTHIFVEKVSEMLPVENDDVIQELPTKASDKPLHEGILPRRVASTLHFLDPGIL